MDLSCTPEAFFESLMTPPLRLSSFFKEILFIFYRFSQQCIIFRISEVFWYYPYWFFSTSNSIIGSRSFFFSQHLFLVFDNFFFHFPTLVSKHFFCNFELLNSFELLTFFQLCGLVSLFRSFFHKNSCFLFNWRKTFFLKYEFFISFHCFFIFCGLFSFWRHFFHFLDVFSCS